MTTCWWSWNAPGDFQRAAEPFGLYGRDPEPLYYPGQPGLIVVERERLAIEGLEGDRRTVEVPDEDVYVEMWSAMYKAWQRGEEAPYTLEHGWQEMKTLLAIARSIEEGRKVALEEMNS